MNNGERLYANRSMSAGVTNLYCDANEGVLGEGGEGEGVMESGRG